MTSFIHKKLSPAKALPEILREERLKANLSLDEVSFKTQIIIKYLEALEKGAYEQLPGEIYNKQFIKRLAKLYSLAEKTLLKIYQEEKESQLSFQELLAKAPKTPKHKMFKWLEPKTLRLIFIALPIIGCLIYLSFEIINIFTPPLLVINSPMSQTITPAANIKIIGQTEPEAILLINHQKILPEPNGAFTQTLDLTMGLNIFEISAKKKHSKASSITLSILRQAAAANEINLLERPISFR